MSKFLADKEHGRERQETLLNAADAINEEDDTDIANGNTPTDGGSVGEPAF